jgi:hypothetical protein
MRPVRRDEIVDYVTYNDHRPQIRAAALAAKKLRRYEFGALCFLFENAETVRYQVQEMMRVERIVRESAIQHELDTYNELIGGPGELKCSLLIGLPDEATRAEKLSQWMDLLGTLYVVVDGAKVRPTWDERQVGDTRLSSVQYLTFAVGDSAPTAIGCDHADPTVAGELALSDEQRAALALDLER